MIDTVGLLDSAKYPWNGADVDFTARAFKKGYIYKILPPQPELVVHYRGMSRRTKAVARVNKELLRTDDRSNQIISRAGLRPWKIPKFLWQLYKRLPGKPFYELTPAEKKTVAGKLTKAT